MTAAIPPAGTPAAATAATSPSAAAATAIVAAGCNEPHTQLRRNLFAFLHACLFPCRMSISWSRLLPQGVKGSSPSAEGIKWYRAVFKELKDNGIEPAVTLYHWDMPQVQANVTWFTVCMVDA
jgi:hypothetical protein